MQLTGSLYFSFHSAGNAKRKKSDDEDDELDDRLEDEDYDLIEENLGVKVERVNYRIYLRNKPLAYTSDAFISLFRNALSD